MCIYKPIAVHCCTKVSPKKRQLFRSWVVIIHPLHFLQIVSWTKHSGRHSSYFGFCRFQNFCTDFSLIRCAVPSALEMFLFILFNNDNTYLQFHFVYIFYPILGAIAWYCHCTFVFKLPAKILQITKTLLLLFSIISPNIS